MSLEPIPKTLRKVGWGTQTSAVVKSPSTVYEGKTSWLCENVAVYGDTKNIALIENDMSFGIKTATRYDVYRLVIEILICNFRYGV